MFSDWLYCIYIHMCVLSIFLRVFPKSEQDKSFRETWGLWLELTFCTVLLPEYLGSTNYMRSRSSHTVGCAGKLCCFSWMTPNHYVKTRVFHHFHPLKPDCLGSKLTNVFFKWVQTKSFRSANHWRTHSATKVYTSAILACDQCEQHQHGVELLWEMREEHIATCLCYCFCLFAFVFFQYETHIMTSDKPDLLVVLCLQNISKDHPAEGFFPTLIVYPM